MAQGMCLKLKGVNESKKSGQPEKNRFKTEVLSLVFIQRAHSYAPRLFNTLMKAEGVEVEVTKVRRQRTTQSKREHRFILPARGWYILQAFISRQHAPLAPGLFVNI